jgi:hypothetical protein
VNGLYAFFLIPLTIAIGFSDKAKASEDKSGFILQTDIFTPGAILPSMLGAATWVHLRLIYDWGDWSLGTTLDYTEYKSKYNSARDYAESFEEEKDWNYTAIVFEQFGLGLRLERDIPFAWNGLFVSAMLERKNLKLIGVEYRRDPLNNDRPCYTAFTGHPKLNIGYAALGQKILVTEDLELLAELGIKSKSVSPQFKDFSFLNNCTSISEKIYERPTNFGRWENIYRTQERYLFLGGGYRF